MKAGRSLINITSLEHTKFLWIVHLDSVGLYWDEIERHIENILKLERDIATDIWRLRGIIQLLLNFIML